MRAIAVEIRRKCLLKDKTILGVILRRITCDVIWFECGRSLVLDNNHSRNVSCTLIRFLFHRGRLNKDITLGGE
jgi:hypothetical protein